MIEINGAYYSLSWIVSAEIANRFYMNGSAAYLVVVFQDGSRLSLEHGRGFDAYKALDTIKAALT